MNDGVVEPARTPAYSLVPARSIDDGALVAFAAAVWPRRPPHDRILSSWWRRADPICAVAAISNATGIMAALCGGRPSQWAIGGRAHPAVAITDWYVAPGHTGKLVGRRLVRQFEAPGRMMYAFSLSDDAVAYLRALGWVGPYPSCFMALPIPRLARLVHLAAPGRSEFDLRDREVTGGELPADLAAELDRIESRSTPGASAHMRRDAAEWRWRLPIRAERTYRFCVAYAAGEPVGYAAVRRLTPGRIRRLGKIQGAFITDLVGEDPSAVRALARGAVAIAADMGASVALAATTTPAHERILARLGFLSSKWPVIGGFLKRRAPHFMWSPRGPAAALTAAGMALTLADATIDFDL
jgi:acetyltransferase (GNAT) family protein